jgi:dihydroorotate dehydrogenase
MPVYPAFRRLLFQLDAETAHRLALAALRSLQAVPPLARLLARRNQVDDPALRQTLFGRVFPNPVGLAAGFDKDARVVDALPALGFGFAEVGTVTPRPQAGNPPPRMFRHAEAESVRNALGFNNAGMDAARRRLEHAYPAAIPLGVNVGKNRDTPTTPPDAALDDYAALIRALSPACDYLVVNLSSPNTPGLRDLQNEAFVRSLLAAAGGITRKPVLVKIAPDFAPEAAAALAEAAVDAGAAGIVATNTTNDYSLLPGVPAAGGLSGKVLREKSFRILEAVATRLFGRAVLISVGGIDSGAEAYRRLRAGASLVQIYTALIYHGPTLPRRINQEILELMTRDGVRRLAEVVGADRNPK